MTVRELLMQDDLNKVSELLWLSDSYIMGDLFGSLETARIIGPYIFSDDKKALFYAGRTLIAEENGKIQGILCYRDGGEYWDTEHLKRKFVGNNSNLPIYFQRVNELYLEKLTRSDLDPHQTECMFLATDPNCRGRGIGGELLKYWLEKDYDTWYIDVLKANENAIRLYKRFGFKKIDEFDAYPLMENHRCIRLAFMK